MQPITWRLLKVHDGQNRDVIGLEDINDRVRKRSPKVSPDCRWTVNPKKIGVGGDIREQTVNMPIKALAKLKLLSCVIFRRIFKIQPRFRMEADVYHRPTILRISAMTCSPGIA